MQLSVVKRRLESTPLFLVMVPLYVLLHLEIVYHHIANYRFAAPQIVILLLVSLLFTFFSRMIEKDKQKSFVIAFVLMLFWSYLGLIKNFIDQEYAGFFLKSYRYFLPLSALALTGIIFLIKKTTISFPRLYLFINVLWILLISTDTILLLKTHFQKYGLERKYALTLPDVAIADSLKPDIYYIIFDSYTSGSILKKWDQITTPLNNGSKIKGLKLSTVPEVIII